jgi:hypothetical protein
VSAAFQISKQVSMSSAKPLDLYNLETVAFSPHQRRLDKEERISRIAKMSGKIKDGF